MTEHSIDRALEKLCNNPSGDCATCALPTDDGICETRAAYAELAGLREALEAADRLADAVALHNISRLPGDAEAEARAACGQK